MTEAHKNKDEENLPELVPGGPTENLKVNPSDKDWLEAEAAKLKRAGVIKKDTQAHMLRHLREVYVSSLSIGLKPEDKGDVGTLESKPPDHAELKARPELQRAFDMLGRILGSGHKKAIAAIRQNLDAFEELIRRARGEEFDSQVARFDRETGEFEKNAGKLRPHAPNTGNIRANRPKRGKVS